jgi:mono/diheme cytochrome c family protein
MRETSLLLVVALLAPSLVRAAPALTPALLAKGKAAYATTCALCHGDDGDGMGPAGKYMDPKPQDFSKGGFKKGDKLEQIFTTISDGLPGTAMTGYKYLPEGDRWAIAHYVQSFKKKAPTKK